MARKKAADAVEDFPERLSSGVTVIVRTTAAIYDTLSVQKVGGIVTVGLPGASLPSGIRAFAPAPTGDYVPPVSNSNLDAARASLAQLVPGVSSDAVRVASRDVVSPASLGLPSAEKLGLIGGGAGGFVGRSNEDTDA